MAKDSVMIISSTKSGSAFPEISVSEDLSGTEENGFGSSLSDLNGSETRSGSEGNGFGFEVLLAATFTLAFSLMPAEAQFYSSEGGGLSYDPFPRTSPGVSPSPSNPTDNISIAIPGGGGTGEAGAVLNRVDRLGNRLGKASGACGQTSAEVSRYLSCISDALDSFAAELDRISSQLPPGMQNVARIVEEARGDIDSLRRSSAQRLARATSDAQREAIRRETLAAAAQTMETAASDIRKSISLIRASDPELANIQRETVFTVAQAVDNVGIQLTRAIGL